MLKPPTPPAFPKITPSTNDRVLATKSSTTSIGPVTSPKEEKPRLRVHLHLVRRNRRRNTDPNTVPPARERITGIARVIDALVRRIGASDARNARTDTGTSIISLEIGLEARKYITTMWGKGL